MRGSRKHCFVHFCSLAVLESSVDEGWLDGTFKDQMGHLRILFKAN